MNLAIGAAVFPVIFVGELPDKTMFASLVLASRGRPLAVWLGTATAFAVHVVIAVSIGAALFALVSRRVLDIVVGLLFLAGAALAYRQRNKVDNGPEVAATTSSVRTAATAGAVIFLAEWGDLTQILIANLAARYHSPVSVAAGSTLALWAVAGVAVAGGTGLLKVVSVRTLRLVTAVVLVGFGAYSLVAAATV